MSTWAKVINMGLGVLMVVYSVFSFFSVALDVFDASLRCSGRMGLPACSLFDKSAFNVGFV